MVISTHAFDNNSKRDWRHGFVRTTQVVLSYDQSNHFWGTGFLNVKESRHVSYLGSPKHRQYKSYMSKYTLPLCTFFRSHNPELVPISLLDVR